MEVKVGEMYWYNIGIGIYCIVYSRSKMSLGQR